MTQTPPQPIEAPKILSSEEARGAVTGHKVRYVLAISVLLAVAAMVSVYVAAPGGLQDGPTTAPGPR